MWSAALHQTVTYWLAEHPLIVGFRWSPSESWGSTWSFLFTSIALYVVSSVALHLLLLLLIRHRPLPLGPLPALHSLLMALLSATILAGTLLSAAAEIRDTRWLWRRSKTTRPLEWLLCFPLGTRPSGRVFFWSYAFYLSRFLRLPNTLFSLLSRRTLSSSHLFNRSAVILMSFLALEFSQSFHVLGIILTTSLSSLVYAYRFWTALGFPAASFPFVPTCHYLLLASNVVCHVGVLLLHLLKGGGGCNGIAAWGLNCLFNAAILLLFLFKSIAAGTGVRVALALEMEVDEVETVTQMKKKKKKVLLLLLHRRVCLD